MSDKKILMPLEEIMGERFGRYSKYIIQDRALPDVRDGLKPVQRRILYAMFKEGNTHLKPYRKSAKTVGNVIGNYHPHGDTSVYDAMVRLSQDWKMRVPLVDMQGNNGSIDNDPAAAMRYTEARLSPIALELLAGLDKETVTMALNFDDTEYEPTVLPAKYPNILVNGATGISAGYATDIPPHNFEEVIDATVYRIKHPSCSLEDLMQFIKGPDFPTGAIVEGKEGIMNAFKTGRGKVVVRSKVEIQEEKNMNVIVVDEIPYEVNKADLVRKIDEIRLNKNIDGILEVRDESDRTGLRVVVEVKKDANVQNVLNYLYKNTDLQKNYNYNVVAIKNKRPTLMGLIEILDSYIEHQIDVVTRRSIFDLNKAQTRQHIIDGLIKAISILDDVVKTIRASKDKGDAKHNLIEKYQFTEKQAEAIVMLQLYRLTNTDIVALQKEHDEIEALIIELNKILNDPKELRRVIISELKETKSKYKVPRLTIIQDHVKDITVNKEDLIIPEDIYITVTRDGYVKRISPRSYKASEKTVFGKKEDDVLVNVFAANTVDKLLLFTNKGNYLYIPIHELEEFKWKDVGKHISYMIKVNNDEKIIKSVLVKSFDLPYYVCLASANGQVKRTALKEFEVTRYSKPIKCMNLKGEDELVDIALSTGEEGLILVSEKGYAALYSEELISILGIKAAGIKGINAAGDRVVGISAFSPTSKDCLILLSEKGYIKKIRLLDIPASNRTSRGVLIVKKVKSNEQRIVSAFTVNDQQSLHIIDNAFVHHSFEAKHFNTTTIDTRFASTIEGVDTILMGLVDDVIIAQKGETKIKPKAEKKVIRLDEPNLFDAEAQVPTKDETESVKLPEVHFYDEDKPKKFKKLTIDDVLSEDE